MTSPTDQRLIDRNIRVHDRVATRYEQTHDEIFNDFEQSRLKEALGRAKAAIATGADRPQALDFGCGSGNLTRRLLGLGFEVVAADVSRRFLDLVERRHRDDAVTVCQLDGTGLGEMADDGFDLAAAYSVLHHVPDYLAAVAEMARVIRPGGILYIDHEHSPGYWEEDPVYSEFVRTGRRFDWRKFLEPHNYYGKLRRALIDPKYSNEGDIHVWPDDHVEWGDIDRCLADRGFEPLFAEDYLVYRAGYRPDAYARYRSRCTDMRVAAWRKGR
jgi:ubiquinone/menaquinone biosynthesis C-methylase UbiE